MSGHRLHHLLLACTVLLTSAVLSQGCASRSGRPDYPDFSNFNDLKPWVFARRPDVKLFRKKGPFGHRIYRNMTIRLTRNEQIELDYYISRHKQRAPLVIFQHGNLASKSVHENQAKHIASWGMHAIVVSQPNEDRWIKNGHMLAKLVRLLYVWPHLLDNHFDPKNIIAVGHSFGGSAIAIAAGSRAPLKGVVFLDPALVNSKVKHYLKQIHIPAVLLGADTSVFRSRRRKYFYNLVPGNIVEISVRGATHNDAQSPNLFSILQTIGLEQKPTQSRQLQFKAAIVASAFGLASTGKNTFTWAALQPGIERGRLIRPRRK